MRNVCTLQRRVECIIRLEQGEAEGRVCHRIVLDIDKASSVVIAYRVPIKVTREPRKGGGG